MRHFKYEEVKVLIQNNINVLLEGEAGSGKTTLIKEVVKDLDLNFYAITGTKQVTMNALLGFISINGNYIRSQFREAVEFGGVFFISEIDGMDPNTLLCLNTLENGYIAFPDAVIDVHIDFRLCADSNPSNQHQIYTGRSQLDGATLDRFDKVKVDRDPELEVLLTSAITFTEIQIMREVLEDNSITKTLSMRDTIRYHKRKEIGLDSNYATVLLGEEYLVTSYNTKVEKTRPKPVKKQSECKSIDELWETISTEGKQVKYETSVDWASTTDQKSQSSTTSKQTSDDCGYTRDYLIMLTKDWVKRNGNIPLPEDIEIKKLGFTTADPFNKHVIVYVDNIIELDIKLEELQ